MVKESKYKRHQHMSRNIANPNYEWNTHEGSSAIEENSYSYVALFCARNFTAVTLLKETDSDR